MMTVRLTNAVKLLKTKNEFFKAPDAQGLLKFITHPESFSFDARLSYSELYCSRNPVDDV